MKLINFCVPSFDNALVFWEFTNYIANFIINQRENFFDIPRGDSAISLQENYFVSKYTLSPEAGAHAENHIERYF